MSGSLLREAQQVMEKLYPKTRSHSLDAPEGPWAERFLKGL